ncbi:Serine/threonine protein kinase PrkC, regulator of stationary phase [Minicystis rosea]|nr:Serine/threonine protein kinase PrkC, regulator of stationary phase [Minicystis rosea]
MERSLWHAATLVADTPEPLDATTEGAITAVHETTGRYRIHEVLGSGGMGEVRLCRDGAIGRDVALKTLLEAQHGNVVAQRRFVREVRVQGQLEHPSIVPVYDFGTGDDGRLFFTMRRVRGHTLAEVLDGLARGEPSMVAHHSRRKLLDAFVRVCLAVDYAHSRGVLHRDLKPSNIMLGDFGEVYVLDWGVARLVTEHTTSAPMVVSDADLLAQGNMVGTPGYMSPEQLLGLGESQDARTDVYALGAILFEILTHRRMHQGDSFDQLAESTRAPTARRAADVTKDVPPELDAICAKASARDRADRHQSARELAEAVERYLDGDRDLERRRALSTARVAAADAALAQAATPDPSGKMAATARTDAVREVTAALALDSDNEEARRLLVRLFVEAPPQMPPEVEAEINTMTSQNRDQIARFGSYALGSWTLTPFLVLAMGVRQWLPFLVCTVLSVFTYLYALWARKTEKLAGAHRLLLTAMSLATVASVACWLGPFVLVPQAVAITTLWIAFQCRRRQERWAVVALGVLAVLVPFVLELGNVFSPAYVFEHGNLTLLSRAVYLAPHTTVPMLIYASVTFVALPAIFLGSVRDALNAAERQLFLQAWHLRKLLPEQR